MSSGFRRRATTTVAARNLSRWLAYVATTWWRGGPDYYERIEYFTSRALLRGFRGFLGACAAMFAAISLALLFVEHSKVLAGDSAISAGLQLLGAAVGLYWAVRWQVGVVPTERTAFIFTLTSTVAIVGVCWTDVEVMAGVSGLSVIVLVAVYTAFMLPPRHLVMQSVVTASAIALFVPPILAEYGPVMAAVKSALLLAITIVFPVGVQIGMAFLSDDATSSDSDPLTGALNRRGFRRETYRGVVRQASGRQYVPAALMVIDVNDFKLINDTLGHETGDAVLVRVADVLRDQADGAVVARIGGDEFAVAVAGGRTAQHVAMARRMHGAIEGITVRGDATVTASIGVAIGEVSVRDQHAVDVLLAEADEAMYQAKRADDESVVINNVLQIRPATSDEEDPLLAGGED